MDEGYIKFRCQWVDRQPLSPESIRAINPWRNRLHAAGVLGIYENGVGFGNISQRTEGRQFIISGTRTGGLKDLTHMHYAQVTDFDFNTNSITCEGAVRASSESLSHAAVYSSSPDTNAVIHIHHLRLWEENLNKLPTTGAEIPYGTPEMAEEIRRLITESDVHEKKVIIMAGHSEGLLVFGDSLDEAGSIVFDLLSGY